MGGLARPRCASCPSSRRRRNDLLGRQVAEQRGIHGGEHLVALARGQPVRRGGLRATAAVIADVRGTPALERARADADELAGLVLARAGRDGLVDEVDDHLSLVSSVPSSPSPQRAWTFFLQGQA
jgi:hypothetical protein